MELKKNKSINQVRILLGLFVLWVLLSLIAVVTSDFSPTVLSYNHHKNKLHSQSEIKGNTWRGTFIAKENYLGIISIDFADNQGLIKDIITFKIRQQGDTQWLVENNYDSRSFYTMQQFPLGFPIIVDSKNKTFEFEFSTRSEDLEKSFVIDKNVPIVVSKYQFPLNELLEDPRLLLDFMIKKIIFAFTLPTFTKSIIGFSAPFFIFAIWAFFRLGRFLNFSYPHQNPLAQLIVTNIQKVQKIKETPFGSLILLLVFINIFVLKKSYTFFSLLIIVFWIILLQRLKISFGLSFFIALTLCLLIIPAYLLSLGSISERLATWVFYFLGIGCFRALIVLYGKKKQ